MCYDDKAQPPVPPGASGQASGENLVLTAKDGNQFAAFLARPENPREAQILIYPDVRGLHQFYKELALRFAEVGYTALAFDYFGRSAGLTERNDSFDFMPHVMQISPAGLISDVQSSLTYLRQAGGEQPVFAVGFCMGVSFVILNGTNAELNFAGLIPFYASLSRDIRGSGTVLDNADKVTAPVLGLFGGNDPGIPAEQVHELERKLQTAGQEHTVKIYDGAPHSFFDRRQTEYAEASSDAWQRILEFIAAHSSK